MDIRQRCLRRALGLHKMADYFGPVGDEGAEVAKLDAQREYNDAVEAAASGNFGSVNQHLLVDPSFQDDVAFRQQQQKRNLDLAARGPQETESDGNGNFKPVKGTAGTPHAEEVNAQVNAYHNSWRGRLQDWYGKHQAGAQTAGWAGGGALGGYLLARTLRLRRGGRLLFSLLGAGAAGGLAAYNKGLIGKERV